MSASVGTFTFMPHSHLPYARQAGMWPHGEEWVHEAIAETYIPLLNALYDLREEGVSYRLTIGITPILAEQLADPLIIDHFIGYATERAARAAKDIERFELNGDEAMRNLARFYHHWYGRVLTSFVDAANDAGGSVVVLSAAPRQPRALGHARFWRNRLRGLGLEGRPELVTLTPDTDFAALGSQLAGAGAIFFTGSDQALMAELVAGMEAGGSADALRAWWASGGVLMADNAAAAALRRRGA